MSMSNSQPIFDIDKAQSLVNSRVDELSADLFEKINKHLHENPELSFEEFIAHDTIVEYLEGLGFVVTRSAYNLATSFEARFGEQGRQVVFCAEYDALPGIGHSCGHNLIATASVAGFLSVAHAMAKLDLPGRLRLLGTPAEESGGGKIVLIENGAFHPQDVDLAIMAHPLSCHSLQSQGINFSGLAGLKLLARHAFDVEFHGQPAHAAGEPWNGTNALDAAVAAYQNVALLRQQIRPDERIHAIIANGGTATNIIPDFTKMAWGVRAPTLARSGDVALRVKKCIEAAALATGCQAKLTEHRTYANLRSNEALCTAYVQDMATIGENVQLHQVKAYTASTDMGNVSHTIPTFHGAFAIPCGPDVAIHSPPFAVAAGTVEAHDAAMQCSKGMAMLALRVLCDSSLAQQAQTEFELGDEN